MLSYFEERLSGSPFEHSCYDIHNHYLPRTWESAASGIDRGSTKVSAISLTNIEHMQRLERFDEIDVPTVRALPAHLQNNRHCQEYRIHPVEIAISLLRMHILSQWTIHTICMPKP